MTGARLGDAVDRHAADAVHGRRPTASRLNSGDAVKTFVDANIQITPPTATNRVGVTHTFTAHVNVNDGTASASRTRRTARRSASRSTRGPGALHVRRTRAPRRAGPGSCTITLALGDDRRDDRLRAHDPVGRRRLADPAHERHGRQLRPRRGRRGSTRRSRSRPTRRTRSASRTRSWSPCSRTRARAIFVPAAGEHVDVTLTPANGATVVNPTGTCLTAGANTDANGQCSITFIVEHDRQGHRPRHLDAHDRHPADDVHGPDRRSAPEQRRRGQDLRQREDLDRSGRDQRGRPAAHLHGHAPEGSGHGHVRGGRRRARQLHADGLERRRRRSSTPRRAPATTPARTPNANGQCTIMFNSATAGQGHRARDARRCWSGLRRRRTITVATDGTGLNSADAVKTYVDANIQITRRTRPTASARCTRSRRTST